MLLPSPSNELEPIFVDEEVINETEFNQIKYMSNQNKKSVILGEKNPFV